VSQPPPGRRALRRDLLWLAVGAAVLYTMLLGARDLWNPNEPLYGRAVVEMAERGDWLVPTVNGEVFDEKPILYYWLALAAAKLFGGVNEFTVRLPSALIGVACVVMVYLLVYPYSGRRRAQLAALAFSTIFVIFWSARSIQMDLLLGACTLGAILAATRVLDHGLRPSLGWPLVGAAVGLGFLTKGPVGIICPGIVVFLYSVSSRRLGRVLYPGMLLAAPPALIVASPWYVALWAMGKTEFLYEMLIRQNFTRFVEPWDHAQPWWYFARYFWIDMAPWAFFVPLAAALPERDDGERRLDRLCWLWILGLVFFFSLSASKRSAYILPIAPAVAVLAAAVGERALEGRLGRLRSGAVLAILGLLAVVFLGAGAYAGLGALDDYPALRLEGRALALLFVAGGAAILLGLLQWRRSPAVALTALFAFVFSLYLMAATWVLPATDIYKSARTFGSEINAIVGPDEPLHTYRSWKWRASYVYYADRIIPHIDTAEALREYWARPDRVYLVVEDRREGEVQELLGPIEPIADRAVGGKHAYLFSNRRQDAGAE
jgi:4-amino-4-deoxy-L-arabinose transferase-like glycosyltransferase